MIVFVLEVTASLRQILALGCPVINRRCQSSVHPADRIMQRTSADNKVEPRIDFVRLLNAHNPAAWPHGPPISSLKLVLSISATPKSTPMAFHTSSSTSQQGQMEYEMLLNGPAGTPPAGVVPNFASPPNLHVYINLTLILCFILATLACFTRMYTRMVLLRSVGYDDCKYSSCILCDSDNLKLFEISL